MIIAVICDIIIILNIIAAIREAEQMTLKMTEIKDIFDGIKKGQAVLVMGQGYLTADPEYYRRFVKKLEREDEGLSFNDLWKKYSQNNKTDVLGSALRSASEAVTGLMWVRAIMTMGWNGVYTSFPCMDWLTNSAGQDMHMHIMSRAGIGEQYSKNTVFNKKNMPVIPLFGSETELPQDKKSLRKLKDLRGDLETPCERILEKYGYLIIDRLEKDDWFSIAGIRQMIGNAPYGRVYIFGVTEQSLEDMCPDEDAWEDVSELLDGRLQLCEKTLEQLVDELGLTARAGYESEEDRSGYAKLSVAKDDHLWIERSVCSQLEEMGITLLRDELMGSLSMRRRNIRDEFVSFLMQGAETDWRYFSISDGNVSSFYINRGAEEPLRAKFLEQLGRPVTERSMIFLRGNSNTGKTTTLRWFARDIYMRLSDVSGKKKERGKHNDKYVVMFISGRPELKDSNWTDNLKEIIKQNINGVRTEKNELIKNVVVIWDNPNSQHKRADYEALYKALDECNAVIIGSIFGFEFDNRRNCRNVEIGLSPTLKQNEDNALMSLLEKIDTNMYNNVVGYKKKVGSEKYNLFELLSQYAEYGYSDRWQDYREKLRAKFSTEAGNTEEAAGREFKLFEETRKYATGKGIGAVFQQADDENNNDEQFENKITDLNKILAVAGQFNKTAMLPESLLLKTIMDGQQTMGTEIEKIRKILGLDSMVLCESNAESGVRYISFRHHSEAQEYLYKAMGPDDYRMSDEIVILKRLIRHCDWVTTSGYPEAEAVAALTRCFGPNSFGKSGDDNAGKGWGQYDFYKKYWCDIAKELQENCSDNPEAILIAAHFTREALHGGGSQKEFAELYESMKNITDNEYSSIPLPSKARLYGEMCRNLLEQMDILDKEKNDVSVQFYEFEELFRRTVSITKKCNGKSGRNGQIVGTALLLDNWLNYVLKGYVRLEKYLSETLLYIELLLYDEEDFIGEDGDYVNVLDKIDKIYEYIGKNSEEIEELFKGKNNDSWLYLTAKKKLLEVYKKFGDRPEFSSNKDSKNSENDRKISARVFFLNERAGRDFADSKDLFAEIKQELRKAAGDIISLFDGSGVRLGDMTLRCLRMYLQAKWMFYTGNLLLEEEQKPGLTNDQWKEISEICRLCTAASSDDSPVSLTRAAAFIHKIYRFVFAGERWDMRRYNDSPYRLICLCRPADTEGRSLPRAFRISAEVGQDGKVKAKILNGNTDGMSINKDGRSWCGVASTVLKLHPELKTRSVSNMSCQFELWFNQGGPLMMDLSEEG